MPTLESPNRIQNLRITNHLVEPKPEAYERLTHNLENIEAHKQSLREINYLLYNLAVPKIATKLRKQVGLLNLRLAKDHDSEDLAPELILSAEAHSPVLTEESRDLLKSLVTTTRREGTRNQTNAKAELIRSVASLDSFDFFEKKFLNNILQEDSALALFTSLGTLRWAIGNDSDFNKAKLSIPFAHPSEAVGRSTEDYMTYQDILAAITHLIGDLNQTGYVKLIKYINEHKFPLAIPEVYSQAGHNAVPEMYHFTHPELTQLLEKLTPELQPMEIECIRAYQHSIPEGSVISIPHPNRKYYFRDKLDYLDIILKHLYGNLWVESKVQADLQEVGSPTNKKERKAYSKLKSELYTDYKLAFGELETPWRVETNATLEHTTTDDTEVETVPVPAPVISEDPRHQASLVESKDITNYLEPIDIQRYEQATPEHMRQKVNRILAFLAASPAESNSLAKTSFLLKYGTSLPYVRHQYCAMRFGTKEYPQCLKLNLNRGDRLVCYYDQDQLRTKYYSAQEYHNQRSK